MIGLLSQVMSVKMVCDLFLQNPLNFRFHMKKPIIVTAWNLQNIKNRYSRTDSNKSLSQLLPAASAAYSNCPVFVRACLTLQSCAPKSSAIDLAFKTCCCLLEWQLAVNAKWQAAAWTWTQTWTLQPDQLVVMVLCSPKSWNKLLELGFSDYWRCQNWAKKRLVSKAHATCQLEAYRPGSSLSISPCWS